jgi:serine/threonine protein kinase
LIDFGVAVLHPLTPSSTLTCSELCSNFFALSHHSPISTQPFSKPPNGGLSQQIFLCKPIPHLHNKPGKIRYMSPELFSNQSWDAYKNDMFSLGVILYSLLTGRPPFQHADSSDIWYHVIASGQWLTSSIMNQPTAHVYTHVSMEALELVNRLIKPQQERWNCKQVLEYSWMNKEFNEP